MPLQFSDAQARSTPITPVRASYCRSQAPMRVELIQSDAEWQDHAAHVRPVLAQPDVPVFATQGWLDAAWQWRNPDTSRHFCTISDGARCLGFVPLVCTPEHTMGLAARTLHFLTVPDTQVIDVVAAPDAESAVADAVARHLSEHRRAWDVIRLNYLSDTRANWRALSQSLRAAGIDTFVEPAGINAYIDLTGGFDAYYATRTRKLKKGVNLSANRLERLGSVSVEWVREGAAEAALAEAVRISALSWKQGTGNSLDQPGPRAFIERLTAEAARNGTLSLWLLRVGGQVVATEYQLIAGGNVYALRADFDPAYADASPGTFLNHHILTRLFDENLSRYYMGPGANAYKLRWTDTTEPVYRLTAFSPTARGGLLRWMERSVRPFAKLWRDRLLAHTGKAG